MPPIELPAHPQDATSIMHFDQLLAVAQHHHDAIIEQKMGHDIPTDLTNHSDSMHEELICTATMDNAIKPK